MSESIRGRGASSNPANRFIPIYYENDPARADPEGPAPQTQFFRDQSRSIVATNDSPDVGFTHSINPYRGCEHGCSYCYARPFHEYLGFSAGLDFETRIMVKGDAPELLREELMKPSWKPVTVALSGVTDCYQPIERRLQLTRRCLQVLHEFRNPAGIVTKNQLVARDVDILAEMASYQASSVCISITTLDGELARKLEPRATQPSGRLAVMEKLAKAGVPVGAMVAPIIPGLNDHEVPAILEAVRDAGGSFAGYTILRLPLAVAEVFSNWLEQHFPERKDKVLNRLRSMRGGKLNEPRFGKRMRGQGTWSKLFHDVFALHRDRLGFRSSPELSTAHFRRPGERNLFEELS
ncbi:MAG TPA: PA0069 family radical SAM protein [Gemmataceae bacterium]|nr:PA0069 family radical SAM protein [Gemmataceae bacterium]